MNSRRFEDMVDLAGPFIQLDAGRYPRIHANLVLALNRVHRDVLVDLGWAQARFAVGTVGDRPVSVYNHPIRNELTFKISAGLEERKALEIRLLILDALARWTHRHQFQKDIPSSVVRNQMVMWGFPREAEVFASG